MRKNLAYAVISAMTAFCVCLGYGWFKTSQELKMVKELLDCSVALHELDSQMDSLVVNIAAEDAQIATATDQAE